MARYKPHKYHNKKNRDKNQSRAWLIYETLSHHLNGHYLNLIMATAHKATIPI